MTVTTGTYCLYGLTLKSDVPLPCPRVESDRLVPDVELYECSEQELSAACDRVSKSFSGRRILAVQNF